MALQGTERRPVCMVCLRDGEKDNRIVCSADGCSRKPVFMAVLRSGRDSSVLLCTSHFRRFKPSILSYLEVPPWLVDADGIHTEDDNVVFDFELGIEERPGRAEVGRARD